MAKKKLNIMKDLKKMGLIPTKKQQEQMYLMFGILVLILITGLAMYGAWKYPIPHHYYENMNYPANHYSNFAILDELEYCECGNDPTCDILNKLKAEAERYRYYV